MLNCEGLLVLLLLIIEPGN